MRILSNGDIAEALEGLHGAGLGSIYIQYIVDAWIAEDIDVADIAYIIELAEAGDDDELFMHMAMLGVA